MNWNLQFSLMKSHPVYVLIKTKDLQASDMNGRRYAVNCMCGTFKLVLY
jgi:hypothetical protein